MLSVFIIIAPAKNITIAGGKKIASKGCIDPLIPIALKICTMK
jgi:hypothetical protein